MKEIFPGHYRKSDKEIKKIWQNGLIVFDTNVLLNLYRYSAATREIIINLIKRFSDRIYLPHQAALEYNRNRYEVIAEQEKGYKEFLEKISALQDSLESSNKPPFFSKKTERNLKNIFKDVEEEVQNSIENYSSYLKKDPIYEKISLMFKDKITTSFTKEELEILYKEGEKRYENKTPPSFKDKKDKNGDKKYGDLILWKQIIDIAKKFKKDVILVTDDAKTDWWWKLKDGRNMGPRHELIEEIKLEARVNFHMYTSERFLKYGQSYFQEKININALEEIEEMKRIQRSELRRLRFNEKEVEQERMKLNKEIKFLTFRLEDIKDKAYRLKLKGERLIDEPIQFRALQNQLNELSEKRNELEQKRISLSNRRQVLSDKLKQMDDNRKWNNLQRHKYFNRFDSLEE